MRCIVPYGETSHVGRVRAVAQVAQNDAGVRERAQYRRSGTGHNSFNPLRYFQLGQSPTLPGWASLVQFFPAEDEGQRVF